MNDPIQATRHAQSVKAQSPARPFVCLTYAQSLDGSIAARPGQPYPISAEASMQMTHELRALHDCLLIGIGTALADDPQLTVRLVEGDDPDPVILDTNLRLPPTSRLLSLPRPARIFCATPADPQRTEALSSAGASIHTVSLPESGRLDLHAVMDELHSLNYGSVMVEGGANVITQFLQAKLVDWIVITIAPLILGGLHIPNGRLDIENWVPIHLDIHGTKRFGPDYVIWGEPNWEIQ